MEKKKILQFTFATTLFNTLNVLFSFKPKNLKETLAYVLSTVVVNILVCYLLSKAGFFKEIFKEKGK